MDAKTNQRRGSEGSSCRTNMDRTDIQSRRGMLIRFVVRNQGDDGTKKPIGFSGGPFPASALTSERLISERFSSPNDYASDLHEIRRHSRHIKKI